jgi:hypothetical protein
LAQQVWRAILPAKLFLKPGSRRLRLSDTTRQGQCVLFDLADEVIVVEVAEAGGLLGMSSLLAQADHLTTPTAG